MTDTIKKIIRGIFSFTGVESQIISETKKEIGSKMVFASDDFSGELQEFLLQAGTGLQLYNYIPYKVIKAKIDYVKNSIRSRIKQ